MIAVYPFTPHPAITKGIIEAADIPVFSGVGGGLTQGMRSAYMSLFAEAQGSMGVVLNGPTPMKQLKWWMKQSIFYYQYSNFYSYAN